MGSQKTREQRQVVFLNARLRTDDGWSDVTICNLSSRGLMVKSPSPPPKGAFVELRRGSVCIVGQVRWSLGARFGLRSQDRIDIAALATDEQQRRGGGGERRQRPRTHLAAELQRRQVVVSEERSRQVGRLIDWLALAVAGIAGAGLVASEVYSAMATPMEQVQVALTTPPQ